MGGFQPSCPLRDTNFDNHLQMTVFLWEPKSAPGRFQNPNQAKPLRIDALKRVRRTVSFYSFSTERPPWPTNSPMGESETKAVEVFYVIKVSGYQLKRDCYNYKVFYVSLMVITKKKPV